MCGNSCPLETAEKWGLTKRRVNLLCQNGDILKKRITDRRPEQIVLMNMIIHVYRYYIVITE